MTKTKSVKNFNTDYQLPKVSQIIETEDNTISIYPYGVNKGKLEMAANEIGINILISANIENSDNLEIFSSILVKIISILFIFSVINLNLSFNSYRIEFI